jgi:DNA-binding MarR family transcriptional regulator
LLRALRLPGKALHVALLLWQEAGCRRSRTIRFRLAGTADLEMHPDTAKRGLRALEKAGLVSIRRHPGQALEVTLLAAPSLDEVG